MHDGQSQKLSVIIPIYNAEKDLNRCVKSVLNQTYKNIEVILIDDGSTDKSSEICDFWKHKDNRVSVYHLKNEGPSHARNFGLNIAQGRYVAFVDADDFLNEEMYEKLIEKMISENCEMAICKWMIHDLDEKKEQIVNIGTTGKIKAEKLKEIIASNDVLGGGGYPWNRVIDLKSIQDQKKKQIEFREGLKVYEDKIWILEILDCIKNVVLVDYIGYNYELSKSSLSHRSYSSKIEDLLAAWKIIDEECFENKLTNEIKDFRAFWTFTYFWRIKGEKQYSLIKTMWPKEKKYARRILRKLEPRHFVQYILLDMISKLYIK